MMISRTTVLAGTLLISGAWFAGSRTMAEAETTKETKTEAKVEAQKDRIDDQAKKQKNQIDDQAKAELFARHRARLRVMVRLRMDRRLAGRIDPSDVLQEAYLDFARRLPEYLADRQAPFFLWLRGLTGQRGGRDRFGSARPRR